MNEPQAVSSDAIRKESAAQEEQTRLRVAELSRLEMERDKRQQAAARMEDSRKSLQVARTAAWSGVIATNWQALQALRQKAAASPGGETPCTLCDGKGYMGFCILCHDHGKCPSCTGTGHASSDAYCPTCLGTGKCYLCFGSRHMSCPFCNDGMIAVKWPLPPSKMPVN